MILSRYSNMAVFIDVAKILAIYPITFHRIRPKDMNCLYHNLSHKHALGFDQVACQARCQARVLPYQTVKAYYSTLVQNHQVTLALAIETDMLDHPTPPVSPNMVLSYPTIIISIDYLYSYQLAPSCFEAISNQGYQEKG